MAYERINWQNEPSEATALNDVNLNKMDSAIYDHDQRLDTAESDIGDIETALDNKVDKESGKGLSTVSAIGVTTYTNQGGTICDFVAIDQSGNTYHNYIKNGVVIDSALSPMSQNPVENRVVKNALDNKVDKESGKGLSQVDNVSVSSTTSAGTKIGEITVSGVGGSAVGTNLYNGVVVDSAISSSSENPVQNKVISEAFRDILPEETATGNPITITDGSDIVPASECAVTMNPIQDLHGYEYPWVGGAGKNKAVKGETGSKNQVTFTVADDGKITTSGTPSGSDSKKISSFTLSAGTWCVSGCPSGGGSGKFGLGIYDTSSGTNLAMDYGSGESFTLTESTEVDLKIRYWYGFNLDNKVFAPQVESGSTPTSFAPYENICPISGRDSVTVFHPQESFYNNDNLQAMSNSSAVALSDNSIQVTSTANGTYRSSKQLLSNYSLTEGKRYRISAHYSVNKGTAGIAIRNSSNSRIAYTDYVTGEGDLVLEFVLTSEMNYLSFFCTGTSSSAGDVTYTDIKFSEVKEYTHTYSSTVYGGVDDFVSGEGKKTHAIKTIGDINWSRSTSYTNPFFYSNNQSGIKENTAIISENYGFYGINTSSNFGNNATNGQCGITANGLQIFIRDDRFTDATAFKTAMSDVKIAYELATPTTITNTPEDVTLLKGVNVVSTDGDSLELKYSADIKAYIDSKLAQMS